MILTCVSTDISFQMDELLYFFQVPLNFIVKKIRHFIGRDRQFVLTLDAMSQRRRCKIFHTKNISTT